MKTSTLLASSLVAAWQLFGAFAQDSGSACSISPPRQSPSALPVPGSPMSQGCYTSSGNMTEADIESIGVSSGSCREYCTEKEFYVFALHVSKCFCGYAMPPEDARTDDENCDYPCPAFCPEACGSRGDPGHFSVFNLGKEMDPPIYEEESSTTSSSATEETTAPADEDDDDEVEQPAVTTDPAEQTTAADDEEESSGPNVGGIVAGVVVGVVVLLGAAGGLFFYMRRKRNSEIEEEHRRNAAVNAFISGSKPPGSSGSISMTDSRLDPIMAHRRLSDGSIADNEDYSRKILRVTNA